MKRPEGPQVSLALAVCGVLAGFGITAGVLHAVRGGSPAAPDHGPGAAQVLPRVIHGGDGGFSPQALDEQWLTYSDHSDCAQWSEGDGVSAIRLNSSQVAWFFADTILGPAGPATGFSKKNGFVHNSVVMQTTEGNRTRLVTLLGGGGCSSSPASVVSAPASAARPLRYWDADGARVGGTVVKFYNSYLLGTAPYVPVGTTIASFSVRKLSAAGRGEGGSGVIAPVLTRVPAYTPPGGGTPIMWGSAVLKSGGTVYIYGWQSPSASSSERQLYLARVRASRLADVAAWHFYAGGRWAARQSRAVPIEQANLSANVAAGFSVVAIAGRYWLIQTAGAGNPDIYAYSAPAPWGPFNTQHGVLLYRAPGIGLDAANDYRIIYEARAEPALSTSKTLVISYNVNSEAVTGACQGITHFTNAIIQPRFIAVPVSAFTGARRSVRRLVHAGGSAYPRIVQRHPAEWFNALSFPGGCPPVPGVSGLRARTGPGLARLTWRSSGIGMRYLIYLDTDSHGFAYLRTVSSPRATVGPLTAGLTYDFKVIPVSVRHVRGPAAGVSVQVP